MNSLWSVDGARNSCSWFTQNLHDIAAKPSWGLLSDSSCTQGWSQRMVMVVKTSLPVVKTLDIIPVSFFFFFLSNKRDSLRWSSTLIHDNVYLSSLVRNSRISLKDWGQTGWEELTDLLNRHAGLLQCSCLENPMDRGSWRAAAHGVMKSWTRLSNYSSLCFSYVCPLDSWGGSHWLHGQGGLPRKGQLSFSSILSLFITDGLMIKMTISAGCRLCMVSTTWTFPHQGWFLYCVW